MASDAVSAKEGEGPSRAASSWRRFARPFGVITGYYIVLVGLAALAFAAIPGALEYAPIGGAGSFDIAVRDAAFQRVDLNAGALDFSPVSSVKLALSIVGAFALMVPVTWICMGTRRRRDISQSFIQTILVLPMVITGIVHVVHDSLALAFSLAGIVAGVRFRHTLKDTADTTYLFTAIGVGVACGINAVEVAAIISIFFNYAILGLWASEFGERATGQSMFAHRWMTRKEHGGSKHRRGEGAREPVDDDDATFDASRADEPRRGG